MLVCSPLCSRWVLTTIEHSVWVQNQVMQNILQSMDLATREEHGLASMQNHRFQYLGCRRMRIRLYILRGVPQWCENNVCLKDTDDETECRFETRGQFNSQVWIEAYVRAHN